ncbi:MAG: glycosyltransferase family 4 protein [Ruminococcaceae bacterium]|nr:glycosyltransferase family 4 protein [Oscillospiraceae bacterium]
MKILVLSTIYPRNDVKKNSAATKVVHYFVSQWTKMGHQVVVIHTAGRSFKLLHLLPQSIKNEIKTRSGIEITDINITKKCEYNYEGIEVFRRPIFKSIPHALPSKAQIQRVCRDICEYLKKRSFEPELIISHWSCPTIQLLSELNKMYSCRKSIVIHETQYLTVMKEKWQNELKSIDVFGCRSSSLSKKIAETLGLKKYPFVCASGVPEDYLETVELDTDKFDGPLKRYIFVGELIARKNCESVIKALASVCDHDWHIDIVGDGAEMQSLKKLLCNLKIEEHVTFHGKVSRDEVIRLMRQAQCFIMPSRAEAFGLVYLEAMACSCITIGSRGEGIDGIINDKQNGYLVQAGSVDDLEDTLKQLLKMNTKSLKFIAENGYKTAQNYSDFAVAKRYLDDVIAW